MTTHADRIVLLAVILLLLAGGAAASPSNKWRLEFSGNAKSDGVIELELTPKGSEAFTCHVEISKGTGENKVAKTVKDVRINRDRE